MCSTGFVRVWAPTLRAWSTCFASWTLTATARCAHASFARRSRTSAIPTCRLRRLIVCSRPWTATGTDRSSTGSFTLRSEGRCTRAVPRVRLLRRRVRTLPRRAPPPSPPPRAPPRAPPGRHPSTKEAGRPPAPVPTCQASHPAATALVAPRHRARMHMPPASTRRAAARTPLRPLWCSDPPPRHHRAARDPPPPPATPPALAAAPAPIAPTARVSSVVPSAIRPRGCSLQSCPRLPSPPPPPWPGTCSARRRRDRSRLRLCRPQQRR